MFSSQANKEVEVDKQSIIAVFYKFTGILQSEKVDHESGLSGDATLKYYCAQVYQNYVDYDVEWEDICKDNEEQNAELLNQYENKKYELACNLFSFIDKELTSKKLLLSELNSKILLQALLELKNKSFFNDRIPVLIRALLPDKKDALRYIPIVDIANEILQEAKTAKESKDEITKKLEAEKIRLSKKIKELEEKIDGFKKDKTYIEIQNNSLLTHQNDRASQIINLANSVLLLKTQLKEQIEKIKKQKSDVLSKIHDIDDEFKIFEEAAKRNDESLKESKQELIEKKSLCETEMSRLEKAILTLETEFQGQVEEAEIKQSEIKKEIHDIGFQRDIFDEAAKKIDESMVELKNAISELQVSLEENEKKLQAEMDKQRQALVKSPKDQEAYESLDHIFSDFSKKSEFKEEFLDPLKYLLGLISCVNSLSAGNVVKKALFESVSFRGNYIEIVSLITTVLGPEHELIKAYQKDCTKGWVSTAYSGVSYLYGKSFYTEPEEVEAVLHLFNDISAYFLEKKDPEKQASFAPTN